MILKKTGYHKPETIDMIGHPDITFYRAGKIHLAHYHSTPPGFVIQFRTSLDFRRSLEVFKYIGSREKLEEGKSLEIGGDWNSRDLLFSLNYQSDDIIRDLGEEPQYMCLTLPSIDGGIQNNVWNNRKFPNQRVHKGALVSIRRKNERIPEYLSDVVQKFGIKMGQNDLSSVFTQFEKGLASR